MNFTYINNAFCTAQRMLMQELYAIAKPEKPTTFPIEQDDSEFCRWLWKQLAYFWSVVCVCFLHRLLWEIFVNNVTLSYMQWKLS